MGGGVEKILSQVDVEVKAKILGDAIALVKRKTLPEERFKSYEKLSSYGEEEECETEV